MRRALLVAALLGAAAARAGAQAPADDELPDDAGDADAEVARLQGAAGLEQFGPRYTIESINVRGNRKTARSLILRELTLHVGDQVTAGDARVDEARVRLLSLGFFVTVRLSLEKGSARGNVILVVQVNERSTIILNNVFLGTSEATGFWGGLDGSDSNFIGRGVAVGAAFVVASEPEVAGAGGLQQAYRLRVGDPDVLSTGAALHGELLYNRAIDFYRVAGDAGDGAPGNFRGFRYSRIGGSLGVGLDLTRLSRMTAGYRFESVDSERPDAPVRTLPDGAETRVDLGLLPGRSQVSSFIGSFELDTRPDPVLPRSGTRVAFTGEWAPRLLGSSYDFAKATLSFEKWLRAGRRGGFGLRVGAGAIIGDAPQFDRFYVGDLSRLLAPRTLGLVLSTQPARDFFGTRIEEQRFGILAAVGGVEYAHRLFRRSGHLFGGDLFLGIGIFGLADADTLRVRDANLAESLPIDLSFDVGLRFDTYIGVFELSLGNTIGRLPF